MKNSENMDHLSDDSVENRNKNSDQESKEGENLKPESSETISSEPEKILEETGSGNNSEAPTESVPPAPSEEEVLPDDPPESTEIKSEKNASNGEPADPAEAEIAETADASKDSAEDDKPVEEDIPKNIEDPSAEATETEVPSAEATETETASTKATEVKSIDETAKADKEDAAKKVPSAEATETKAPPAKAMETREEKVNFELLSRDDLVQLLEEDLNKKPFEKVKEYIDEIKNIFNKKNEEEIAGKKEKFISEGGNTEDFKPFEDPASKKMDELLHKVKSLKADYNKQQEQSKEQNLAEKQEILEELRLLMEGQETFDNTFRKFKQLQKRWFDSGFVPQQNVKDLWNSYNYFVDKFNDYVKINRELRALDLKKNLEFKISLCEKVEELTKEEDAVQSFKTLQKYHAQWRETGPVPREDKDVIWERFKAATSLINKAHQSHQSDLRVSLVDNLEKKEKLCARVEEIAANKFDTHRDWNEKTQEILGIQKEWKTIGYAPKKDNNLIYARFRKACDIFFGLKAEFYAETFELQKDNLVKKEEIVAEAENLKDSTEWKETTNKLINLQKKWKEIGPVPRRDSDRLWKKFRSACDHFFAQKSEFYSDIDSSYDDNLKAKLELIEELKKYKAPKDRAQITRDLDEFNKRYAEIGYVPVDKKEEIRESFRNAFNDIISNLDVDEQTKSLLGFRSRLQGIMRSPKADIKFGYEREKLHTRLQQLKTDIGVWENNIGFIKQTESSENTISGYQEKLDDAKSRIELLEKKISLLDRLENEL